jgi:probable rRNA maturation factor
MNTQFYFQKQAQLSQRLHLKSFFKRLSKREGTKFNSLTIIFCSDDYLLEINRNHLQHDYFTDIITFDLTPPNQKNKEAELYISIDRVRENARHFKSTVHHELHRVIFHGILHLCGYKDKTKAQQQLMREKENEYLELYFNQKLKVPRGTNKKLG